MAQIVGRQTPLVFKVTKQKSELITPANPTPCEFKELSDIDDQPSLRVYAPGIQFYRSGPANGPDPVKIIKEALRKALVAYYPLAGRLKETEKGKLVVDCNGDGVLFIEAYADVTLFDFGETLYPPFPYLEKLFYDLFKFDDDIFNHPLFIIQVTRLRCGGFILAHKINHVVADGSGFAQFMHAVAELARGAESPSVHPVWDRHLLRARNPPQVTSLHCEYDEIDDTYGTLTPCVDVVHKSFFFGPAEIAVIRRFLPTHLKSSSTFEVLTACIWRSRTIAMQLNPNDEVRLRFFANVRPKFNPPLPTGYYGNVIATPVAISTARKLTSNPLGYALELIKSAKGNVNEEYIKSLADFMVTEGRPRFSRVWAGIYVVSDVSRVGLDQWDFGWGKAVFGGPAKAWLGGTTPGYGNYFLTAKNGMGESGIMVPMFLPRLAMDRFVEELNGYLSVASAYQPISTFQNID